MFLGETLPSGSIVDLEDVLNVGGHPLPSNRNPASANVSLQCILTDLVDCCGTESGSTVRTERGITGTFLMGLQLDLIVVHGF